jgi:hypothetical protein
VRGALEDERVLLVTTPQTPADLAERLTPLLEQAGAQVSGTLQVLPALSDPAQGALVEDLVAQVVPAGVELPDTGAVERATTELAAALTRTAEGEGVEAEEAQAVVSAFTEADLVEFASSEPTLQPATLAGRPHRPCSRAAGTARAGAAAGRRGAGPGARRRGEGAVVAGPSGSAGDRGPVRVLRSDGALAGEVSSVDNADRGTGLVTLVLALAEQRRGGAGQYGTGEGASTALPSPPAQ